MKTLPKGIRVDKGYVQVRIFHHGVIYCKNFGKDSPFARELASIHLAEKRKDILMGKFDITTPLPSKKFNTVADIYLEKWCQEKDEEGKLKHTPAAQYTCRLIIRNSLRPFFGSMSFDLIRTSDVQKWRAERLKEVAGTSVNREQAVLSSIFSHTMKWVEQQTESFKVPVKNPCQEADKSSSRRRERVLSTQELGVLKQACVNASDTDLWEICKMALKSLLRKKDLMRLENGESIDMKQAKTGIRINLPVQVLKPLNYVNFRKRWEAARKSAGLTDVQFRDLRKTGNNLLKMLGYSRSLRAEFLGHADESTTAIYDIPNSDHLKPLANGLANIVDNL